VFAAPASPAERERLLTARIVAKLTGLSVTRKSPEIKWQMAPGTAKRRQVYMAEKTS
jgi:hypothetical protein